MAALGAGRAVLEIMRRAVRWQRLSANPKQVRGHAILWAKAAKTRRIWGLAHFHHRAEIAGRNAFCPAGKRHFAWRGVCEAKGMIASTRASPRSPHAENRMAEWLRALKPEFAPGRFVLLAAKDSAWPGAAACR